MSESGFAAWVGLDWADKRHWVCLCPEGSDQEESYALEHQAEAIQDWLRELERRFGGRPVAVVVEQTRGALIYALGESPVVTLLPVSPRAFASYRRALRLSGAKDDPNDARLLMQFGRRHRGQIAAWKPETAALRELRLLNEQRRRLVDQRTAELNRLTRLLKEYFPQLLDWFPDRSNTMALEFLTRWPTLQKAQRARRATLEKFFRHHRRSAAKTRRTVAEIQTAVPLTQDQAVLGVNPMLVQVCVDQLRALSEGIDRLERRSQRIFQSHRDAFIFASFPGAGAVMAPRLLAAFGSDRQRYDAVRMQCYSGIAPVTKSSGKNRWVHHRWVCPKFLKQTFHEFAKCSILESPWAKAAYQYQRSLGNGHHRAVRRLAFRWIRILNRCWQDRVCYCEQTYQQELRRRHSPVVPFLEALDQ